MRNFPLQRKLIIGGLAILLLGDVAFAYFSLKLSSPRKNRQERLAAEMRQRDLVKADIKRATEIRRKIPQVLKQLDEFEGSLLPSTKGYSVVAHEMDEHARDSHVTIEDVKFHEKEVTGRNLTELTLDIATNGDYNGIVHFLNHLQRSKIAYIIDGLEVDSQNAGQAPAGTLKVSLHMRTYFRKA
jgi:type IV pilus assembly protein PilO